MSFTAKVTGAKEIAKAMALLPRKVERKIAIQGLRLGGKLIIEEAKRIVPVRTGRLRRSIGQGVQRGKVPSLLVGIRRGKAPYAHMVEFGTSKMAPRPFMRPALDAKAAEAIRVTGESIGPLIEKEARKGK